MHQLAIRHVGAWRWENMPNRHHRSRKDRMVRRRTNTIDMSLRFWPTERLNPRDQKSSSPRIVSHPKLNPISRNNLLLRIRVSDTKPQRPRNRNQIFDRSVVNHHISIRQDFSQHPTPMQHLRRHTRNNSHGCRILNDLRLFDSKKIEIISDKGDTHLRPLKYL